MGTFHRARLLIAALAAVAAGCAADADRFDRGHVSAGLVERTGREVGPGDGSLPPGVTLEDGIREEEAISLALWNNAAFQEALAELGLRRADLVQAGMLPNPIFSVLFPVGPKQLEMTLKIPMDAIWLRPGRMAAAELDCERVSALLVQGGLDLVRDVRIAYSELRLARDRAAMAGDIAVLRSRLSDLMQARLRRGDVSELEAGTFRVDAMRARADAGRSVRDEAVARERLRLLIGFSRDPRPLAFTDESAEPAPTVGSSAELLSRALAARPDLRGAELAIDAAKERADLAGIEFFTLNAGVDTNSKGKKGFELGPALDVAVPIFNQGQGADARAAAELERTLRHRAALQDRISLEVREARVAYAAALEARAANAETLPLLQEAIQQSERAERAGQVSPLVVIESRLRLMDGQVRDADARAELHRARAHLERSVGGRLP